MTLILKEFLDPWETGRSKEICNFRLLRIVGISTWSGIFDMTSRSSNHLALLQSNVAVQKIFTNFGDSKFMENRHEIEQLSRTSCFTTRAKLLNADLIGVIAV